MHAAARAHASASVAALFWSSATDGDDAWVFATKTTEVAMSSCFAGALDDGGRELATPVLGAFGSGPVSGGGASARCAVADRTTVGDLGPRRSTTRPTTPPARTTPASTARRKTGVRLC